MNFLPIVQRELRVRASQRCPLGALCPGFGAGANLSELLQFRLVATPGDRPVGVYLVNRLLFSTGVRGLRFDGRYFER